MNSALKASPSAARASSCPCPAAQQDHLVRLARRESDGERFPRRQQVPLADDLAEVFGRRRSASGVAGFRPWRTGPTCRHSGAVLGSVPRERPCRVAHGPATIRAGRHADARALLRPDTLDAIDPLLRFSFAPLSARGLPTLPAFCIRSRGSPGRARPGADTCRLRSRAIEIGVTTLETDLAVTIDGVLVALARSLSQSRHRPRPRGRWLAEKGPPIHC